MTIQLNKRIVRGWKAEDNSRFGFCVVVQFVDAKTGKVLFEYAPTLEDKEFFGFLFNDVLKIDKLHKDLINAYVETDATFSERFLKKSKEDCSFE